MIQRVKTKSEKVRTPIYLSQMVDQIKKNDNYYDSLLKEKTYPLWIPSKYSFLKLILIFLGLVIIVKFGTDNSINFFELIPIFKEWPKLLNAIKTIPTIESDSNSLQTLIAINSGIGAVLTGLAFFVAQSLMNEDDPDKARVLLYKSKFFPLLSLEVFIFFLLIIGEINYSIYVITIILGVLTIISLGKTIRILIRNNDLENAKSAVFFDILNNYFILILDNEIIKRLSNNIFYKYTENLSDIHGIQISHSPLSPYDKDSYITLKVHKEGSYSDVNLEKLDEMIIPLTDNPGDNTDIDVNQDGNNIELNTIKSKEQRPSIIFHTTLFSEVKPSDSLISIKKDLVEFKPKLIKEIKRNLDLIFIIKDVSHEERDARFEISKLKERSIDAIKNENISDLEKNLKVYNNLIIEFYKFTKPYGGYSKKQAEQERTALFTYRIKPLDWISRDIWEIFEKGMKSEEKNIIMQVAYLPVILSKTAIQYNDHLIFQSYIHYVIYLYKMGFARSSNINISNFMIDRSWRYLTELVDYFLIPYYKNDEEISWNEFSDFAQYIIKVFQEMIKNSYDNRDYNNFKLFIEKMFASFDTIKYSNHKENNYLTNLKRQTLFGLGSWILDDMKEKDDFSHTNYLLYITTYLPNDIEEITKLFLEANSEDVKNKWDWINWEFSGQKEKEVFWSGTSSKIEQFYLFLLVKSANKYEDDTLLNVNLPVNYDFAHVIKREQGLISFLKKIKENSTCWRDLLTEEAIDKIDTLVLLLDKTKDKYDEREKELIRKTKISSDKVNSFKENFEKNLADSFGIKDIYKEYNHWNLQKLENSSDFSDKNFGIHTFFDKPPFLKDDLFPHTLYTGFEEAFDYGKASVRGENSFVVNKLKEYLQEKDLNKINNILKEIKIEDDLILISINNAAFYLFEYNDNEYSKNYMANWSNEFLNLDIKNKNNLSGVYKINDSHIPVYNIYSQDEEAILILMDTKYMGEINQYVPKDVNKVDQIGDYSISIKEMSVNSEAENHILEEPPNWLRDRGDRVEQSKYLQEKVIIKITEKIDFKIDEEIKGAIIYVDNSK
ncbi:hypothetical protein [Jeotgalibaca dankookensis]|uniref:hypothetical protein n=1 Tax=Jeotgalibaca dankookensis TaxID=708126 RepID=UPI000783A6E6|nr:hypothetical protein [Jeotgalibaca dankookensis]